MKKHLLLLLLAFFCVSLYAQQQIKIINFTVKNQLPAVIDNWNSAPGSLLLVAQMPPGIQIKDIRLVLQIKANGAIVCSNSSIGGMAVDNFTTRTFSAAELTGAFAGCHDLKDGTYTICAQFFNIDRRAISNEACKDFTVETPKETDYAPPTLITPENGKSFTEAEMSRPVTFRWTPIVPKPREPVTYRLKVWQLMQGQNGIQAMRSNQPIISKDVNNITQAAVSNLWTGPCKPPYLCDFIWQVQAINKDGKPMGRNEGNSEPYTFSVKQNETQATIKNIFPDDKKQFTSGEAIKPLTFRWTPLVPKPGDPVTYRLKVWQLMQGQSATQAMRSNQPIVTREVDNITEATVSNIYTGPCKPPYLCDFIWNVEASVRHAGAPPQVTETSEPTVFGVMGTYAITIQSLKVECPKGNSYSFTVNIGNPNNSIAIFDKLEVVLVNGVIITPLNITPTVPAIGSTIPANGNINVSASFPYGTTITTVCLKAYIKEQLNPLLNTASSYTCDTLRCPCDPCKTLGVTLKDDKLTTTASTSGQILLSGLLSGLDPNVVKKITMELVYFNIEQTGDSNCVKCAENREWGNFIKPSSAAFSGYSAGMLNGINFGREWTWLTTVQKDCDGHGNGNGGVDNGNPNGGIANCTTCGTSAGPVKPANENNGKVANAVPVIIIDPNPIPKLNTFSLPIAVPPGSSLKCCGDKIKVCIRYTIWDFCCHACDVIKCYEIERKAQ